jgi:hypothetical protein
MADTRLTDVYGNSDYTGFGNETYVEEESSLDLTPEQLQTQVEKVKKNKSNKTNNTSLYDSAYNYVATKLASNLRAQYKKSNKNTDKINSNNIDDYIDIINLFAKDTYILFNDNYKDLDSSQFTELVVNFIESLHKFENNNSINSDSVNYYTLISDFAKSLLSLLGKRTTSKSYTTSNQQQYVYQESEVTDGYIDNLKRQANIFTPSEVSYGIFNQRFRYGVYNPYSNLTNCREILFFTKPDLNITENQILFNNVFWNELKSKFPQILRDLQSSNSEDKNPFINLLGNMVQSTIDVPSTTADMIETPANQYGVSYKYRGSSEAGDDNFTFSLEFKDTKYLPVYRFFKAYDLYEIAKHHGIITPNRHYITNKILHDQYAIYKFIIDEDMETILFYAKYYGVKSTNLPRDVFNNTTFDSGISFSIDFEAAFVEDNNPQILADFNKLAYNYWNGNNFSPLPVYNTEYGVDTRLAKCAIVGLEKNGVNGYDVVGKGFHVSDGYGNRLLPSSKFPGGEVYRLKWKG